jgi:hypothetical protein
MKKRKSRKNIRNRKNKRGGVGSIKIRAEPAVEIASKTASFFLNQLFKPLQNNNMYAYDTIEKTKYNFGSYDNMMNKLKAFIESDKMFENTILDAIIKSQLVNTDPNYRPLPSVLKIVTSLKLVPSNLAYYYNKEPERLLKTSIIEFIPDYLKKFIDVETSPPEKLEDILKTILAPLLQPHHVKSARAATATVETRKVATHKSKRRTLRSSERLKDDIIEQIKHFIMKIDYNKTTQNSWYLTTILLELVTNLLGNLQIYSGPLLGMIKEANVNQLITCELLNFLIIQSPDKTVGANVDINFNLVKLYNYINQTNTQAVALVSEGAIVAAEAAEDIDVEDFTIMDFFDTSKNSHGALPPFVLFLLFCRINPEINNEKTSNSSVMDYKRTLIEMTEVNKVNCTDSNINIDDNAAIDLMRRTNRTINPNRTIVDKATGKNKYVKDDSEVDNSKSQFARAKDSQELLREQLAEKKESFHSARSSQVNSRKALSPEEQVIYYDAENGDKIKTTCTPVEISTTWFGKVKDKAQTLLVTTITNTILNPIFGKICSDLYANEFSWETLNILTDNLSLLTKADAFKPVHDMITNNICYYLAPYTTFFPLDLNRYISEEILKEARYEKATTKSAKLKTFLLRPRTPFLNIISYFETKIIEAYKTDKEYTEPLCVPIKIMDAIKPTTADPSAA